MSQNCLNSLRYPANVRKIDEVSSYIGVITKRGPQALASETLAGVAQMLGNMTYRYRSANQGPIAHSFLHAFEVGQSAVLIFIETCFL